MRFYIERMQRNIVRERSRALVLYILTALSCARLQIELARDLFSNAFLLVLLFGFCFDARNAGREQDYKRPNCWASPFADGFRAHFVGSKLASAVEVIAPVT